MKNGMLPILGMAVVLAVAGSPALAEGDAAAGKKLFNSKCKICHDVKAGKHRTGPSLFGVVGRQAGSTDFKKYRGLKGSEIVWNEESLLSWLENPKKFIGKKTSMTARVKKESDRNKIVKYLETLR